MKTRLLFISIITILLFHNNLSAYSTDVHRKITEKVIDLNIDKLNDYLKNVGLIKGLTEYVNNKYIREWIEDGSVKEDYNWNSLYDLLYSHFYEPITNTSGVGSLKKQGVITRNKGYLIIKNPFRLLQDIKIFI